MDSKQWFESKTLWFNILTIIAAILAVPEITTLIPPEWLKYIIAINGLGNIILRVFSTSIPIQGK